MKTNILQSKDLLQTIEQEEMKAKEFGFYWTHLDQLVNQIQSECKEIQEASEKNDNVHLKEEIGDLLLAACSLAIFCESSPHELLLQSIEKFQKRYQTLVELVQKDGLKDLRGKSNDILMKYWEKAKKSQ